MFGWITKIENFKDEYDLHKKVLYLLYVNIQYLKNKTAQQNEQLDLTKKEKFVKEDPKFPKTIKIISKDKKRVMQN